MFPEKGTQSWFEDTHEAIMDKCKVPDNISFETKNKILLDMIQSAHESGNLKREAVAT